MPLKLVAKNSTKKQRAAIVSQNISELEDSGRPHDQAVAIALSSAQRARKMKGK